MKSINLVVVSGRKPEYDYHAPLSEETDLEFVIGQNDAEIVQPEPDEPLWDALKRLEADPDTWKLDIEIRDECGCTMAVVPLFERDAPEVVT